MATQTEVAAHLDMSDRHLRRLIEKGVIPGGKGHGGIDLDAARLAFIRYQRSLIDGSAKPDTPSEIDGDDTQMEQDLLRERLRLTAAQAESVELKNQVSRQELAPVDFMTFALSKMAARVASILDTLPLTMKRRHADLTANHMFTFEREIVRARNTAAEMADHLPEVVDEYFRQNEAKAG